MGIRVFFNLILALTIACAACVASRLALGETAGAPEPTANAAPAGTEAKTPETAVAPVPKPDAAVPAAKAYCETIEGAAAAYGLPPEFFVRLIWQESRFDPKSVSHAGAQGIAQFMPGTARWRGLDDPFEPVPALYESAHWLSELRAQFGNLGLAAAAYNAGPRRVSDWLANRGHLPGETRAYVRIITGRRAADWIGASEPQAEKTGHVACQELAQRLRHDRGKTRESDQDQTAWGPWGLQLLGNWSRNKAIDEYRRLQKRFPAVLGGHEPMIVRSRLGSARAAWYLLRVAEQTRARANALCGKLTSAGGMCLVFKN